jgi:uncharacterized lipoprotein YbaY
MIHFGSTAINIRAVEFFLALLIVISLVNEIEMRKVKGSITMQSKHDIPEGAIATISVADTSRACGRAETKGKVTITNPKIPIQYEVEYDDSGFRNGFDYSLSCRIELNGKLLFINDTHFSIVDAQTGNLLDKVDFHIIAV